MVNSQIVKETTEAFKLDRNIDTFPVVVPVVEVGVKSVKEGLSRSTSLVNATSATLYTAPSDQDCYLTGATLSLIKDVTATTTTIAIQYVDINGANQNILSIGSITLTVHTSQVVTPNMHPIKLLRGSAVTITSATNVATFKANGQIYFFLDEVQ
jgi:hypothetical protein